MNRIYVFILAAPAVSSCVVEDVIMTEDDPASAVMAYYSSGSADGRQDVVDFIVNEEISLQDDLIYYP